ncbi:MAG: DUF4382 domain-containing protein [Terriglobia bacterium]
MKRLLGFGLILSFCVAAMTGCGSTPATNTTGNIEILVGDTPVCNVLSFRALVTGLSVIPQGSSTGFTLLPSSSIIPVDFAALKNTSTILGTATFIPAGTYASGHLAVTAPVMTLFDSSQSPPVDLVTPTYSTENIPFTITPPLVVSNSKLSALRLDFNLAQSIQVNAQGQIVTGGTPSALTATVNPVLTATALTASGTQGFAELDNVYGYVTSVNASSAAGSGFIGSFALQTLSGASTATPGGGPSVTVSIPAGCQFIASVSDEQLAATSSSACQFIGAGALNQLTTGNYTEVRGHLDALGNFVADTVLVENQENLDQNMTAFLGAILSVTKDSSGNVTQFALYIRDEEPSTGAASGNAVSLDLPPLTVNVSTSTGFHYSAPATNFAGIIPDATSLAVGQQVVVHATYVPPATPPAGGAPIPATATAQDIYVPLQTLGGNFSALLSAGSDNLTGGFRFTPCSGIFQGQPVYVLTNVQTQFQNVNGLAGLSAAPQLQTRGLLFFSQNGETVNGVTVPPGSYMLLASVVRQL